MKSQKVRLAYTNSATVTFTPRGGCRYRDCGQRGFIRVNGQTVSGWLGLDNQFFASGTNSHLVDTLIDIQQP